MVFIPRISLEPSNEDLPVLLSYQQFPVHLVFIITINKSQDWLVRHVGLDLQISGFSYSQLYVALSLIRASNIGPYLLMTALISMLQSL
jgi:hypothetical protein